MQHHHAFLVQQLLTLVEEGFVVLRPDMFEHAYRDDAIKRAADIPVILQLELNLSFQSVFRDPFARNLDLHFA